MADSQVVDRRIVEMQFDNAQFEHGVQQSMQSLERLKTATDFDESAKGFAGLAQSIKHVDMNPLVFGARQAAEGFRVMDAVAFSAIQRLTNAAITLGANLVGKVTKPLRSIWSIVTNKGWARASNVKQAQFMIENLGLSWEKAEKDIDEAVTGTRFGFDEAATASSQLAASGLKFGEDMPAALKAISNSASMANVEFSDMANIFTTIAGNGRVMGEQLMQFSGRGLNAASTIAKYFHVTEEEARKMVSKGEVSFKEFVAAVNQEFGDAAHKANETFSGVLANNKAVFARIGQVYASGFMDSAKKVLQATQPMLKNFEKTIKPIGLLAGGIMNVIADKLVPIINRINFEPLQRFIDKYVTPLAERLGVIKKETKETAETIEDFTEMANKVIRGDFGNGQKRREALEAMGLSYEKIQNKVNELLGCSFRYEVAEDKISEAAKKAAEETNKQANALEEFMGIVFKNNKAPDVLAKFGEAFKSIKGVAKQAFKSATGFFGPLIKKYLPIALQKVVDFSAALADGSKKIADWVQKLNPVKTVLDGIGSVISGFVRLVSENMPNLGRLFESVGGFIAGAVKGTGDFILKLKGLGKLKGVQHLVKSFSELFALMLRYTDLVLGKIADLFGIKVDTSWINVFDDGGIIDTFANSLGYLIDGLKALPETIEKVYKSLKGMIPENVMNVLSNVPDIAANLSGMSDVLAGGKESIFKWLAEAVQSIPSLDTVISQAGQWTGLISQGPAAVIGEFIQSLFGLSDVLPDAESGLNTLNSVMSTLTETGASFSEKLSTILKTIISFFTEGSVPIVGMSDTMTRTTASMNGALDTFSEVASGFSDKASPAIEKISEFGKKFKEFKDKYIGDVDWEKILRLGELWVFIGLIRKFGKIAKSTSGLIDNVSTALAGKDGQGGFLGSFASIGGNISGMFKSIGDSFTTLATEVPKAIVSWKKRDFGKIFLDVAISLGLIIGALWLLANAFKDVDELQQAMANLSIIVIAMTGVIVTLSQIPTTDARLASIGAAFAGFGFGLLELVAAVKLFAMIPPDQMLKGGAAVVIAIGVIAQATAMAGTIGIGTAVAFVTLAAAVDMLIPAVMFFQHIEGPALFKAAAAIVGLVFMLVKATNYAGTVSIKTSASFVALALAVDLLVPAVMAFANMEIEKALQGGAAVVILMQMMAKAVKAAGSSGLGAAAAFLAMAIAINILVPAIWMLGSIKPEKVLGGSFAIIVLMESMALATRIARGGSAGSILAMAAAIGVIAVSLMALTILNPKKLQNAVGCLTVTIVAVSVAFKLLEKQKFDAAMSSALAMGLVLVVAVSALYILSTLTDTSKMLAAALALVAVVGVCGLVLRALVGIDPAMAVNAGLALDAFIALIGVLVVAMAEVADMLVSVNEDLPQKIYNFMNGIGLAINAFMTGFKGQTLDDVKQAPEAADSMTSFMDKIQGFIDGLGGVDEGILTKADILAGAMLKLAGAELLNAFANLIGNKESFSKLGESLAAYGKSLNAFTKSVDEEALNSDKMDKALKVTDKWIELGNKLPRSGGWLQGIIGKQEINEFGEKLVAFCGSYGEFVKGVNSIVILSTDKFQSMYDTTDDMIGLSKKLKTDDGVLQFIAGHQHLGTFGAKMAAFANGYKQFAVTLNGTALINANKMSNMKTATEDMIGLAKLLKESGARNGGVLGWIIGSSMDLGQFGKKLKTFGDGMAEFSASVVDIDTTKISAIAVSIVTLHAAVQYGVGSDLTQLDAYCVSIRGVGTALNYILTTCLGKHDANAILDLGTNLTNLSFALSYISAGNYDGAQSFANVLTQIASADIGAFAQSFNDGAPKAVEAIQNMVTEVETTINSDPTMFGKAAQADVDAYARVFSTKGKSNGRKAAQGVLSAVLAMLRSKRSSFTLAGGNAAIAYAAGIRGRAPNAKNEAKSMVSNAANAAGTDAYSMFRGVGHDSADGYKQGIMDYAYKAAQEAAAMVRNAKQAAANEQNSNSPSKEYMKLGKYADEGYILGIRMLSGKVSDATAGVVSDGMSSMRVAMAGMATMLNDGIDADPVITPVMDLSSLQSGIGEANSMLQDSTLNVGEVRSASAISSNQIRNAELAIKDATDLKMLHDDMIQLIGKSSSILSAINAGKVITINGDTMFNYINRRLGQA